MDVLPDTELVRTSISLASGPAMVCTLPPGWMYFWSSITTAPLADLATMSTPTSWGSRMVRSPDTELAPKSWVKPWRSKLMSPLTVLARMLLKRPDAVTSPETLFAVRTPSWFRGDHFAADGVDVEIAGGAVRHDGAGDGVEPGVAADPGYQAVAADGSGLDLDAGRQGDADDHRIVAAVVDGAHQVLEPALRAVQLVPDLEAAVGERDGERVAVDLGDLDAAPRPRRG